MGLRCGQYFSSLSAQLVVWCLTLCTVVAATAEHAPQQLRTPTETEYTIRNVEIRVSDIFDEPDLPAFYEAANDLKIETRRDVVRRELLFREGDKYDPFAIEESIRNLRTLNFLRKVSIVPTFEGQYVDLRVTVQDTWTLIPQVSLSSGGGDSNTVFGLSESNILGYGKRVEVLYADIEGRESTSAVYDDGRFWDSYNRLLAAGFFREDGERGIFSFGRPFRSLLERRSWGLTLDVGDLVDKLWQNADERFIYRSKDIEGSLRYTWAWGNPEEVLRRLSVGYDFIENRFSSATPEDFRDADVDPATVSNDPNMLADKRRFSMPVLSYQRITPDFVSLNYIDKFSRVEDYNLGNELNMTLGLALEALGSLKNTLILSASDSQGYAFSRSAILRAEIGGSSRVDEDGVDNSTLWTELRFFKLLGDVRAAGRSLGRHTIALGLNFDYAEGLDRDREFLLGADQGLRGYDSRTFTGDKRFLFSIEDRMHFVDDVLKLVSVGGAIFADMGGSTFDSFPDLFGDETYADVGVGLRFGFPRSTGGKVVRVDLAIPLRDGPDGTDSGEFRVIFGGGLTFGSRLRNESIGPEKRVRVGVE